jgi:hypothetical protein
MVHTIQVPDMWWRINLVQIGFAGALDAKLACVIKLKIQHSYIAPSVYTFMALKGTDKDNVQNSKTLQIRKTMRTTELYIRGV